MINTNERTALTSELREFLAVLGACEAKRTVAMVINAIDMLEDDASLINEGNKAQQVAVPANKRKPLSDFDLRGVLASNLLCWKRLTEAEAQDLVCFFEKVRAPQGDKS